jgi:hypothetical protein
MALRPCRSIWQGRGHLSPQQVAWKKIITKRGWGIACPWDASPVSGALCQGQGAQSFPPHLSFSPQSSDSIPPGYEPISLLEALNGLRAVSPAIPSAPLYEEITYSGISDSLSQASCPLAGLDRIMEGGHQKGKPRSKSPDR